MSAIAYLAHHPEIEHGTVRIAFNPDEEIGRGTDLLDIDAFGADVAYTLDGSTAGEIQFETFGALAASIVFAGRATHPGSAKGVMVNAVKLAAEFVARLPKDHLSPETTDERDGFVHPGRIDGNEERCSVELILRDFDEDKLARPRTARPPTSPPRSPRPRPARKSPSTCSGSTGTCANTWSVTHAPCRRRTRLSAGPVSSRSTR